MNHLCIWEWMLYWFFAKSMLWHKQGLTPSWAHSSFCLNFHFKRSPRKELLLRRDISSLDTTEKILQAELSVKKLNLLLQCQCSHAHIVQAADILLLISVHRNRQLNINYNWKIPGNLKHLESMMMIPKQKFNDTVIFECERYQVTLLWKKEFPSLPTNYALAMERLRSLVKRL